jgi:Domain of unknown function (DUF6458)
VATPVSLILIAAGLVLALAVHPSDTSSVDVNTVGWILFAVGAVGMLLTLLFWDSWAGPGYWRRRHTYPAAGYPPAPGVPPRRTTVVEEDVPPPPDPPPPY